MPTLVLGVHGPLLMVRGLGASSEAIRLSVAVQNSAHFANEQRKQAQTDARIARLKAQAAQLTPAQLAAYQR